MIVQARFLLAAALAMASLAILPQADAQIASPADQTANRAGGEPKQPATSTKKTSGQDPGKTASGQKKADKGSADKGPGAKGSAPTTAAAGSAAPKTSANAKTTTGKTGPGHPAAPKPSPQKTAAIPSGADIASPPPHPAIAIPAADLAAVKRALTLAQQGKTAQATDEQQSINDGAARKLIEWAILRSDDNGVDFSRYAAFIAANPSWPSIALLRRRAEALLWQEYPGPGSVLGFFTKEPLTAKGRFALARALLSQGDRRRAQALVREAWHNDPFSADVEAQALETFGHLLAGDDHKARMDMRLYADDVEAAMRAANRAGGVAPAIARARAAVIRKAGDARALLDGLPAEAQRDVGVIFSNAQWLRRSDNVAAAAELVLSVPHDGTGAIDTDQWWIERRLLARKLLDLGDARSAYLIARDAVPPSKDNYRVEHQFTAGWIALRFLGDAAAAQVHFAHMADGVTNPISLARSHYWQGRAADAMGRSNEAHTQYQQAARYPTAYYGQIARARIGLKDLALRAPPQRPAAAQLEVLRAVEILYEAGERNLVTAIAADLGDRWEDAASLAALGEVTVRYRDARAMLHVGKLALGRGMPMEHYAFPTVGIPNYKAIGPAVDQSVIYAIARQESTFYQGTISTAKAMGLMQVTPDAGRYVAKKFRVSYDGKRLLSDPVYNVQLGAAELGELIEDYRGSYILAFAGYNAGRGRVREWVARYGDPRDPNVDPIDWVERIPFAETRNYVQRVLENLQVYRVRFGGSPKLLIEADLRRGAVQN